MQYNVKFTNELDKTAVISFIPKLTGTHDCPNILTRRFISCAHNLLACLVSIRTDPYADLTYICNVELHQNWG